MITDKHILIDDQLLGRIKKIHDSRVKRSRGRKTQGDTIRMLLRIGINQYNSESGNKAIREAERQQARDKRQQQELEQQKQECNDEEPKQNSLIKLI